MNTLRHLSAVIVARLLHASSAVVRLESLGSGALLMALSALSFQPEAAHAAGAPAAQQTANDAQRLLDLGHLDQARRLLESRIGALGADDSLSNGRHRLAILLAQAYLAEGQYDRAADLGSSCRTYLSALPDPRGALLAERRDVALLLAAVYEARAQWGLAAPLLEEGRQLHRASRPQNPAVEVDVLLRLSRAWALLRDDKRRDETVKTLDARLAELKDKYRRHQASFDLYSQAVAAYARWLSDEGRPADALRQWQQLLPALRRADEASQEAAVQLELAATHRSLKDLQSEREALDRAADLWRDQVKRFDKEPAGSHAGLTARFQLAQTKRKLARVPTPGGDETYDLSLLRECETSLRALVDLTSQRTAMLSSQEIDESRPAAVRRAAADEIRFLDSFKLSSLQELQLVGKALRREENRSSTNFDAELGLSQEIHDLRAKLYAPEDPRVYRAKLQLGALAKRAGKYTLAHPMLLAAHVYWQKHWPAQTQELLYISDSLASVEREIAWSSDASQRRVRLQEARALLTESLPAATAGPDSADPQLLLRVRLNLGRLCFELGDIDEAVEHFREAERGAARGGDNAGARHALDFQRAVFAATFDQRRAAEVQDSLDRLSSAERAEKAESPIPALMARAGVLLASQQAEPAERMLQQIALIGPNESERASLDRNLALARFIRIQRAAGTGQPIESDDLEATRDYWQSIRDANSDAANDPARQILQARAFYYLSRLRYLEWHAARRHWVQRLTSSSLGRSAPYDLRREKHKVRLLQYQEDIGPYNKEASEFNELAQSAMKVTPLSSEEAFALRGRWRQLQSAFDSLREQGVRLKAEYDAKRAIQTQLVGRASRDLAQLLDESAALAERSLECLQGGSVGPIDHYDPNLHYLAFSNHAEVLFARIATTSIGGDEELRNSADLNEYRRRVSQAIESLEGAAALVSQRQPSKLGVAANTECFLRSFVGGPPTAFLRDNLETSVSSRPGDAPPDALRRLHLLASQAPAPAN